LAAIAITYVNNKYINSKITYKEVIMSGSESLSPFLSKLLQKENESRDGICCCNTSQLEAFIVIGVTALVTSLLWRSAVLAPIKLVAVFLHEFSHASATWLTCGRVSGIEVNENFGGVTTSRGGTRWVILSAGYTGSVVWGAFFILMTWDKLPTQIAASVFMFSCLVTAIVLKVQVN
jgi:hypothetical protein